MKWNWAKAHVNEVEKSEQVNPMHQGKTGNTGERRGNQLKISIPEGQTVTQCTRTLWATRNTVGTSTGAKNVGCNRENCKAITNARQHRTKSGRHAHLKHKQLKSLGENSMVGPTRGPLKEEERAGNRDTTEANYEHSQNIEGMGGPRTPKTPQTP